MRLDQYLAQYWPDFSRSQWQRYVAAGYVRVNHAVELSPKRVLAEDDEVTTHIPDQPDFREQTLPVIYEDDNVIVINKPSGILTHSKGAVNEEFSVAEFVRPRTSDGVDGNRPGIVHRLDRETSGVIIAAKNNETKRFLQKQFQDRKAKKTYIAIVRGTPKHAAARIDVPIERNPKAPSTFRVGASGKPAETLYEVVKSARVYSVLRLKPTTGRTHQLRVHLAHIGTPIAGDSWYGGGKSPIDRLCLHAQALEITLPGGDRRIFEAPMPDDMQTWVDAL